MSRVAAQASTEVDESRGARGLGWLLGVAGVLGLIASVQLAVDTARIAADPGTALSCDVNAFVSCTAVMQSDEAELLGFPNAYLGIVGFAGLAVIGVLLVRRVELPALVWVALQVGVTAAIVFATWLQAHSIFGIGRLCPYCLVVWAVSIPTFVYVTARNARTWWPRSAVARMFDDWALLVTLVWFVVLGSVIWFTFGTTLWA